MCDIYFCIFFGLCNSSKMYLMFLSITHFSGLKHCTVKQKPYVVGNKQTVKRSHSFKDPHHFKTIRMLETQLCKPHDYIHHHSLPKEKVSDYFIPSELNSQKVIIERTSNNVRSHPNSRWPPQLHDISGSR